ncbi:MAG TPA: hypothetical protein VLS28_03735 [Candidatus Sulfomarinibacteraceae bacterium]|nr:hypothetical protein [Candidatus Sulfomarinibacteraceae bacterium]
MTDRGPARRSPLRLLLAGGIVVTGAVWILQGVGILTAGGSFMIGDQTWAVVGAILVVLGMVLGWRATRA